MKEIVRFKSKISQKIMKTVQNNVKLTDPKLVANAFNNYFANIGVHLARSIPISIYTLRDLGNSSNLIG